MATVLWGARKGDVQYASFGYWLTHNPFGPTWMELMDDTLLPGDVVAVSDRDDYLRVVGREPLPGGGARHAVERLTGPAIRSRQVGA